MWSSSSSIIASMWARSSFGRTSCSNPIPGDPFDHTLWVHAVLGHEKKRPWTQKLFTAIWFHILGGLGQKMDLYRCNKPTGEGVKSIQSIKSMNKHQQASTSIKEHQCARKIQNSIISINDFVFPREANLCLQRSLSPNTYGYGYIHRYFAHNVLFIMGRRLRATHIVKSIHIYIYMHVCMYACMYVYIYIYIRL